MKQSLGLLEAKGLLGAITAADAMVKSADIHVLGIEKTKGFGWMTITICGDVGAVQAAIETGSALLKSMNLYIAEKVIPRPAEGLKDVFCPRQKNDHIQVTSEIETVVEEAVVKTAPSSDTTEKPVDTKVVEEPAKEIIAIIETKGKTATKKSTKASKKTNK